MQSILRSRAFTCLSVLTTATLATIGSGLHAQSLGAQSGRDYISIVGSSTVYPFATVVAERFGRKTDFKTPKIESTGSGGGLKLFCSGIGAKYPDVANSSRAIKSSEVETCASNGVADIIEVKIGYDGIVLANAANATAYSLTRSEIFLALAKEVPGENGVLVENPHRTWADIRDGIAESKDRGVRGRRRPLAHGMPLLSSQWKVVARRFPALQR